MPVYCLYPPVNLVEERSESSTNAEASDHLVTAMPSGGKDFPLLFRLSTGEHDVELTVSSQETINSVKKRLHQQHPDGFPLPRQQRWFFGGRLLLDKMKISDAPQIQPRFVVQVIVATPENNAQDENDPANENHTTHNAGKTILVNSIVKEEEVEDEEGEKEKAAAAAAEDSAAAATEEKPMSRRGSNSSTSKRALTPIE